MEKKRCTVCSYTHDEENAPEKCPVCGAEKNLFESIVPESIEKDMEENTADAEKGNVKKWRCMVCAYIHEGEEAPDRCPVCGAPRKMFAAVTEEEALEKHSGIPADRDNVSADIREESGEKPLTKTRGIYRFFIRQILKHHAHPVSVHIPNGVLPVSVFFIVLSAFFMKPSTVTQMSVLEQAAFYNMIFAAFSLPFVIFSGYAEWKNRYGGHLTRLFLIKMIAAGIVVLCAVSVLIWWMLDPNVTGPHSPNRWTFVMLNLIMLGAAALAGMLGGKLVFKD